MIGNTKFISVALVIGICVGLGGGWALWHPKHAPVETYAPPVRQADSSLVLERKPDANAKPAQMIPKGSVLERVEHIVVQPRPVPASSVHETIPAIPGTIGPDRETNGGSNFRNPPDSAIASNPISTSHDSLICPPVRVDLSLVRLKDQTRRVIASSPDGQVVGGVDIPVESATIPRTLRWAAGGIYDPMHKTFGGFIDRDLGPLRVGVEGLQLQAAPGAVRTWAAAVRVGIRF